MRFDECMKNKVLGTKPLGRRKPQVGETYWYISDCGNVLSCIWENNDEDEYRFKIRNVFFSEKEGECERARREVIAELENYAEEHNKYKLAWNSNIREKWCVYYDYGCGRLVAAPSTARKMLKGVYFTSHDIARAAIDAIGEDRIKKCILDAKKCGRCGEIYEPYNLTGPMDECNTVILGQIGENGVFGYCGSSIFELCPKCMNTTAQFLESGNES